MILFLHHGSMNLILYQLMKNKFSINDHEYTFYRKLKNSAIQTELRQTYKVMDASPAKKPIRLNSGKLAK